MTSDSRTQQADMEMEEKLLSASPKDPCEEVLQPLHLTRAILQKLAAGENVSISPVPLMTKLQFHYIVAVTGHSSSTLSVLFHKLRLRVSQTNWSRVIAHLREEFRHRGHAVCDDEIFATNPSCTQHEIERQQRLQLENASLRKNIASRSTGHGELTKVDVSSLFELFDLALPKFPLVFSKLPSTMKTTRQGEVVAVTITLLRRMLCTICDDYKDLSSVVFSSSAFKASDLTVSSDEQSLLAHPCFQARASASNASNAGQRMALLSIVSPFFSRQKLEKPKAVLFPMRC